MSAQKSLGEEVERIDGNVNGLFAKVSDLADRVEELEEENEQLRAELVDAKDDAELALAVAGETSDQARADGGPTKVKLAKLLSRNEVVRRAITTTGKGGAVTGGDVIGMARPETKLYHRQVRDAWDKLAARWESLHVQERDDEDNRLVADRDDLEDELVRLVDEDLSDEQLTERLISGGA
jgi:regulator of replication initiation timing